VKIDSTYNLQSNWFDIPIEIIVSDNKIISKSYDGGFLGELLIDLRSYVNFISQMGLALIFFLPLVPLIYLLDLGFSIILPSNLYHFLSNILPYIVVLYYLNFILGSKRREQWISAIEKRMDQYMRRFRTSKDPVLTAFMDDITRPVRKRRNRVFPISWISQLNVIERPRKSIVITTITGDRIVLGGSYGTFKDEDIVDEIVDDIRSRMNLIDLNENNSMQNKNSRNQIDSGRILRERVHIRGNLHWLSRLAIAIFHTVIVGIMLVIFAESSDWRINLSLPVASYLVRLPYYYIGIFFITILLNYFTIMLRYYLSF